MNLSKILSKTLFFLFLLISPTFTGNVITNESYGHYEESSTFLTDWTPSDNAQSGYGKGRFFYRISRTSFPIDKAGNYLFEIHFISDSYYNANYYDTNGNGVVDANEVFRCSTKIDLVNLTVNDIPFNNSLTNSSSFWLLFKGDYDKGLGDLGISFKHKYANPKIWISWSTPKPY